MSCSRRAGLRALFVLKTSVGGMWIIPQIRELDKLGVKCYVIIPAAPGKLRSALKNESAEIVDSSFDFSFKLRPGVVYGLRQLRKQIEAIGPDVVIYHLYASALATRIASAGLKVRRVHMVAGPLYLESSVIRVVEGFLRGMDDILVSGSAYTWGLYENLVGVRPGRHVILPYGVDTQSIPPKFASDRASIRATLGINPDAFVAILVAYVYAPKISIGQRVGVKGHETALEAWQWFVAAHPYVDAHLLIVGSGFDEAGEVYRKQLMKAPASNVLWIDTVESVKEYYAAADVSISPSISENHGAALEAGATATPQIVSDAGGLPETVTSRTGFVFAMRSVQGLLSAIEAAYTEFCDGVLSKRGERARAFVETRYDSNYSAKRFARMVVGVTAPESVSTWKFVTEARFGLAGDGSSVSFDGVNGDTAWSRYAKAVERLLVAGRGEAARTGAEGDPLTVAELYPLPSYSGLKGFLTSLPATVVSLGRLVASPGLLIVRLPGPLSLIAVGLAHATGRRYAAEVVGDISGVLESGAIALPERFWPFLNFVTRIAVLNADCVRYVTRKSLQEKYPAGPVPEIGISNVRLRESDYSPEDCGAQRGESIELISVGSQENLYKGYPDLLSAVSLLLRSGHDVRLCLIGSGARQQTLRDLADDLGIADRVRFTGQLSRERVLEELRGSSIYVQPSLTEGLPRAAVEAMAQGLPVIGTDVGGIPELVNPRFVVPPRNVGALAEAIAAMSEPDVWVLESRRSHRVSREYSESETGRKFKEWHGVLTEVSLRPTVSVWGTLVRLRRVVRAFGLADRLAFRERRHK